ncbi:hypothetical protein L1887_03294 [Cichorium endivia]|nr:hypothetical protein L1887_03294 [Cichorium endivia]
MSYFGEAGAGNEKSSSAGGSSSRRGKRSGSDKPKQPQRGVLEDIRIQTAYSSSTSVSYTSPSTASFNTFQGHQSHMMGMGELERTNLIYGESQPSSNPRWDASNAILEAQRYAQPAGIDRHLLSPELIEDSLRKHRRKDQNDSVGSGSQNSDSNGSQELDLELRLSL